MKTNNHEGTSFKSILKWKYENLAKPNRVCEAFILSGGYVDIKYVIDIQYEAYCQLSLVFIFKNGDPHIRAIDTSRDIEKLMGIAETDYKQWKLPTKEEGKMDNYTANAIIELENEELKKLIRKGYDDLIGEPDISCKMFTEYVLGVYKKGLYDGAKTPWL